MPHSPGSSRAVRISLLFGLTLLFLYPHVASAQAGHPTGSRGGILVPSANTLPRGAFSFGTYGTHSRVGSTNTLLGLGSIAYGLTDYLQLYSSFSGFLVGSGDGPLSFGSSTFGYAAGPVGLSLRWPGPAERSLQVALNASLTPGINEEVEALLGTGHNHPYARDTFDINLSLTQSLRVGAFDFRAIEGLVITEETTVNIPTHAVLGGGITWWALPTAGIELELLSRLEVEEPLDIMEDYLGVSAGVVVSPAPWLNLRAGGLLGLSDARTDLVGTRAEDLMAYGSVEIVLWPRPRELPERPPVTPVRPGITDSDGDGVPDQIDEEPLTPQGAVVDSVGRAIDSDRDGVPDGLDVEADTPAGAHVDAVGRAVDSDGDGVPDGIDIEPDTPSGAVVDAAGRAVDSDGDGVPDGIDIEPDTPLGVPVNAQGQGLYGAEAELITRGLLRLNTVYFKFDSADIKPESYQTLLEVGLILAKYSELKIEIGGHTDNVGGDDYNMELSRLRAQSVLNWLLDVIPELSLDQFTVFGYGATQPVASNDTEEGRILNRRVEFKVLNPAELDKYRGPPNPN